MASDRERAAETGTSTPGSATRTRVERIPLGCSRRRRSYEQRFRWWLVGLAVPSLVMAGALTYLLTGSLLSAASAFCGFALLWACVTVYFFEQMTRPLQTLSNVVAALREDDFSFRARGARRGDSLGDLALEINALASTLQTQRTAARDALSLAERVMAAMQSPVLAFGPEKELHVFNKAAAGCFGLEMTRDAGRSAEECGLATLLTTGDQELWPADAAMHAGAARWSVRRTHFRLHGVPHELFVLSDIGVALRAEERLAWQRLIRVLSHEINNSLTPIKSIAGSLRALANGGQSFPDQTQESEKMRQGLGIIEDRAASLHRFLQAYQRLTRLPEPSLQPFDLQEWVQHAAVMETRVPVMVQAGDPVTLFADRDQLDQMLINLLRNAAEATLERTDRNRAAPVQVSWEETASAVYVSVRDTGLGLADTANLFVPFYTTKAEGSGIGLVLAQQIATAHGGTLSLTNNLDAEGCTATIFLPRSSRH